ncbi:MAG: hypothetical protein OEY14_16300, partial [Myxococcales bacterium]|nr:hypothetical protein [Myxococcales bacterium]
EEALPGDRLFQEALAADSAEEPVEQDAVDQSEALKAKFRPLAFRIRDMSTAEKVRLALLGDAAARALLVRDSNRLVSHAAISSPSMTESDAAAIAHSKEVSEDVLRYIGNRKEWLGAYEVKRALIFNPKTPVGISTRFVVHLRMNDLRLLARSRGVPGALKTAALQRIEKRSKGDKKK